MQDSLHLHCKIPYKELNAIMIYFNRSKQQSLHMEVNGKVTKIATDLPHQNEIIVTSIQQEMKGLEQLKNLEKL